MVLMPLNGHILVELGSKYKNIVAQTKVYDAKSTGKVVAVSASTGIRYKGEALLEPSAELIGKTVYWQDYKEGATLNFNGKEYTFVKYEDLQGYENE